MKVFMDTDFLLKNDTAKSLYHDFAKHMPIFDYHNHLSAQEIYEDRCYDNIARAWLGADHYKWRAMRTLGVPEDKITGQRADDYEKFSAWTHTVSNAIGNPLYHWTHLELQRYFDIPFYLNDKTCGEVWEICNEKLKSKEYSVRNLLRMQNVKALCTTNDPTEDLLYHKKLKEDGFEIKVLPTFRPDRALSIGKSGYKDYIRELAHVSNMQIETLFDLLEALETRLDYFILEAGCLISDHSLEKRVYEYATEAEAEVIFRKAMTSTSLTDSECCKFQSYVLVFLGKLYARKNIAMQLHIGALRNNSTRMLQSVGVDAGFDSIDDFCYAGELSALLNEMDKSDELPKTILYCLNPRDFDMLASMAGNFQGYPCRGKVQFGTAWWFCDNKTGMENQMKALGNLGLLSCFIGMVTDSRSFLSFPRHEYFRRILCNLVGTWVEDGEFPYDMEYLKELIENISYYNAVNYLTSSKESADSIS